MLNLVASIRFVPGGAITANMINEEHAVPRMTDPKNVSQLAFSNSGIVKDPNKTVSPNPTLTSSINFLWEPLYVYGASIFLND